MRNLLLIAIVAPALLGGCAGWRPTLRAMHVPTVPAPNFAFTGSIWRDAPVLEVTARRGSGRNAPRRKIQLRALCDGQALSILASWRDDSESFSRHEWVWDDQAEAYRSLWNEVDRIRLEWPISGAASFDLLTPEAALYDAWMWEAGWSNVSGYATDQSLEVAPADGESPPEPGVEIYAARDGRSLVRVRVAGDEGVPGTIETLKPRRRDKPRLPGATTQLARGSAADVRAWGLFNRYRRGEAKTWYVDDRDTGVYIDDTNQGYWMVQFYRLLETGDKERDVQLPAVKSIEFAIALTDGEPWAAMLRTPPIRLILPAQPARGE